jgi:creatinine amidohydrolase
VRWADATAPELRAAAAVGAIALWPIGATEQHGAHLATSMDLRASATVCDRAVEQLQQARAVILPGLALGASDHWLGLGATLSLRPATLSAVITDVARSLAACGLRHLVIVNGHAGNVGPGLAAAAACDERVTVEFASYWGLVDGTDLAARCAVDDGGIGHAGEVETAIAMHLGADVFRGPLPALAGHALSGGPGSRDAPFLRSPRPAEEAPDGVYGDPRPARVELGSFVIETAAAALARHLDALAPSPAHGAARS